MISDSILDLAIQTAASSPSKRRIGAVLLKKSRVISTAVNLEKKSHPFQAKLAKKVGMDPKIYLHAEVHALIRARDDADTIVIARLDRRGQLRMSRPCACCSLAIQEAGIAKVYYSTDNGFLYEYRSKL
jgi:deoxycytidylate deaminase